MRRLARWTLTALFVVLLLPSAALTVLVGGPLLLLGRLAEALHLGGGAYRRTYERMVMSRPPMGEMEFARASNVPDEAVTWALAVRAAAAESTGLPAGALHAGDPLAQVWRVQFCGPDLRDIIFRMEKVTSRRLPVRLLLRRAEEEARASRCQTFGDLARLWGVTIAEAERAGELPIVAAGG